MGWPAVGGVSCHWLCILMYHLVTERENLPPPVVLEVSRASLVEFLVRGIMAKPETGQLFHCNCRPGLPSPLEATVAESMGSRKSNFFLDVSVDCASSELCSLKSWQWGMVGIDLGAMFLNGRREFRRHKIASRKGLWSLKATINPLPAPAKCSISFTWMQITISLKPTVWNISPSFAMAGLWAGSWAGAGLGWRSHPCWLVGGASERLRWERRGWVGRKKASRLEEKQIKNGFWLRKRLGRMKEVEVCFGFVFLTERRVVKDLEKTRDGGKVVLIADVLLCDMQMWFCSVLQYS